MNQSERPLTKRQAMVLTYISDQIAKKGYPPTFREIGENFGWSAAGATTHIDALVRKKRIQRLPGISRGMQVIKPLSPDEFLHDTEIGR